jgi:hypothetical protein
MNRFFYLLVVVVGNLVFCVWEKSEIKNVTPDTAFRFNSKDTFLSEKCHLDNITCTYLPATRDIVNPYLSLIMLPQLQK